VADEVLPLAREALGDQVEAELNRSQIETGTRVCSTLAEIRPALEAAGDWDEVSALVERAMARGKGAVRQRAAFDRRGEMADVLALLLT